MVIVLHLWILRDCHQKMNGTYVHNAGLCYFLVTAYPEPWGPVAPRATTTNNKVPGRNMYVLSQYECDWCAWNNSTS